MPAPVYTPVDWVDLQTIVSEANMDHIEQGIKAQSDYLAAVETRLAAEEVQPDIPPVSVGQWLKGAGTNAMVWSAIQQSDVSGLTTALAGKEATANKGVVNGYASLGADGLVPLSQLPGGGGGANLNYRGTWSAATSYSEGDVVVYNGVSYMALDPNLNSTPVPWATAGASGTVTRYWKTTENDISSTSLVDLLASEITIAAGAMGANGSIKMTLGGDYLNNTSSNRNVTFELRLGTTVLWNSGNSNALSWASTRRAWFAHIFIQSLGTTNSQRATGLISFNSPDVASVGLGSLRLPDSTSGPLHAPFLSDIKTVNMTQAQTLKLLCMHNNTGASIRLEHAYIEVTQ